MGDSRRDFLKNSGLVIAGATGFFTAESWLLGADEKMPPKPNPFDFDKRLTDAQKRAAESAANQAEGNSASGRDKRLEKPTIVTIFLRGGADSLNAFVPAGDDMYYKVRPNIAIPIKPKRGNKAVLPFSQKVGNGYWGLNPSMEPLKALIEEGKAVPIMNVGLPHGTRSHFSAQDFMERGSNGDPRITTGWLNRYLAATKKATDMPLRGICAMSLLPRALRGDYPVLAGGNRTEQFEMFEELYAADNLVNQTARDGVMGERGSRLDDRPVDDPKKPKQLTQDWARDVISDSGTNAVVRIKALEEASNMPTDADYPSGGLASQLSTIAQVIKANVGLEVAQADYGGWDHHSDQGDVEGRHSKMMQHLTDCIMAFRQDLGKRMDKVLVLVMSEFGRTVKENGSRGTDHGRGGFMLAVSDSLNGGKFYGTHKGVADMIGGDYQPVYTDYRAVFAESIMKMFGTDPIKAGTIFPNYKPSSKDYLDFMKAVPKAT